MSPSTASVFAASWWVAKLIIRRGYAAILGTPIAPRRRSFVETFIRSGTLSVAAARTGLGGRS